MTKIWQSLWQPGLEASSALAFELGDLFSIIPRSLPTTIKSSSGEGSREKIAPSIMFNLGSLFIIYLGANRIPPVRLRAPWRQATWWFSEESGECYTLSTSSAISVVEKLSRNKGGREMEDRGQGSKHDTSGRFKWTAGGQRGYCFFVLCFQMCHVGSAGSDRRVNCVLYSQAIFVVPIWEPHLGDR